MSLFLCQISLYFKDIDLLHGASYFLHSPFNSAAALSVFCITTFVQSDRPSPATLGVSCSGAGSWVQPSSPAACSPHEEFLRGFRSWNTPADRRGRSQRALSERRKVQPVMQPGRGPDCKGAWTGGWGCALGSQRQGNSREGTHFRIRTGHSALHTCPLRIHLSPRPDVLPSVCLPPAPETSQGPESTSCYVGLISPLSHMLASPERSLAIGTTARFIPLSPSTKHT